MPLASITSEKHLSSQSSQALTRNPTHQTRSPPPTIKSKGEPRARSTICPASKNVKTPRPNPPPPAPTEANPKAPTSIEGKANVATNRMVHGFRSQTVALATEDHSAYNDHLAAYVARYNPQDKPESDLVGLAASNMWQVMRITAIESALFDLEISGIENELHRDFEQMDEYGRLALSFKKANGENGLELLRRYKATAERAYHRAWKALEEIKRGPGQGQGPGPAPPPPTPRPDSNHAEGSVVPAFLQQNRLVEPAEKTKSTIQTRETPQPVDPQPVAPELDGPEPYPIEAHPSFKSKTPLEKEQECSPDV